MRLNLSASCVAYLLLLHSTFGQVADPVPDEQGTLGHSAAQIQHQEAAWQQIESYFQPPAEWEGKLEGYTSPLVFQDGRTVENQDAWEQRRNEILQSWHGMLGPWPELIVNPELEVLDSVRRENFTQQQVRFKWTPQEYTTGYLLLPEGADRRPAVITVFYEPETAIGWGTEHRDFALQLARRGFVTLSIGTTEATQAKTYALYYPSMDDAQVQPLSMLAYAAANAWYVLAKHPRVDAERIGIMGHSFGGKWAMFASCLFDKFACAAWSDPGIVFDESRPNVNYWEPWYLGYHTPPWRERGTISEDNPARGLYATLRMSEHDLHELHALMAPRPFLVSGGSEDPPLRWQALNHSIQVNRLLGVENRVAMSNRPQHAPDEQSNAIIYAFFEHFLASPDQASVSK
ncbi:MAG: prolyl oligopeptidase family serine peptidase [bacterium]|nr:prolyl oligopeptidase family serine peptidase [bacterium]